MEQNEGNPNPGYEPAPAEPAPRELEPREAEQLNPREPEESPQEQRQRRIVWGLVLLLTLVTAGMQYLGGVQPSVSPPAPVTPSLEMLNSGRYIVGLHQIHRWAPIVISDEAIGQNIEQMREGVVQTPLDRMRLAIVLGEVRGGEEAIALLEDIEPSTPEVRRDVEHLRTIYEPQGGPRAGDLHDVPRPDHEILLEADQRQRLINRHDWFGRLAVTYQQPERDALREETLSQARQTAWTLMGGTLLVFLGIGVGLVLLLLGVIFQFTGHLRWRYRPPRRGLTLPLLESLAVFLLIMLAISIFGGTLMLVTPHAEMLITVAMLLVAPLALLWPLLRGVRWREWRRALGWRRGRGVAREAGLGLVGYLAGLPITALGIMATIWLMQVSGSEGSHPVIEQLYGSGWGTLLFVLALAVVWAPLVEESLFRGAVFHHLRRHQRAIVAAVISALLFAVIHPQGWVGVPALAALGGVLAYIREWRGSVIGCMAAHAVHNGAMICFFFLLTG